MSAPTVLGIAITRRTIVGLTQLLVLLALVAVLMILSATDMLQVIVLSVIATAATLFAVAFATILGRAR